MTNYYDLPKVGESDFARVGFPQWYQAQIQRTVTVNQQLYQQAVQQADATYKAQSTQFDQMLALAAQLYGVRSAVVKYLERHKPRKNAGITAPPNFQRRIKTVLGKYEDWLEDEQRRDYARDYRARRKEMNEFLQSLGYQPGEHYQPSRAITFAKTVVNPAQPEIRMLPGVEEK